MQSGREIPATVLSRGCNKGQRSTHRRWLTLAAVLISSITPDAFARHAATGNSHQCAKASTPCQAGQPVMWWANWWRRINQSPRGAGHLAEPEGCDMGRKPKTITDEQRAQVEALAAYLSQDQIADYLGMTRPTFAALMDRDEDVSLRYKRGRAKAIADVATGLLMQAREGNVGAAAFYLKTQAGWREKQEVKIESDQPFGQFVLVEATGDEDSSVSVN